VQGLVHADLIGTEGAAALQDENDLAVLLLEAFRSAALFRDHARWLYRNIRLGLANMELHCSVSLLNRRSLTVPNYNDQ